MAEDVARESRFSLVVITSLSYVDKGRLVHCAVIVLCVARGSFHWKIGPRLDSGNRHFFLGFPLVLPMSGSQY